MTPSNRGVKNPPETLATLQEVLNGSHPQQFVFALGNQDYASNAQLLDARYIQQDRQESKHSHTQAVTAYQATQQPQQANTALKSIVNAHDATMATIPWFLDSSMSPHVRQALDAAAQYAGQLTRSEMDGYHPPTDVGQHQDQAPIPMLPQRQGQYAFSQGTGMAYGHFHDCASSNCSGQLCQVQEQHLVQIPGPYTPYNCGQRSIPQQNQSGGFYTYGGTSMVRQQPPPDQQQYCPPTPSIAGQITPGSPTAEPSFSQATQIHNLPVRPKRRAPPRRDSHLSTSPKHKHKNTISRPVASNDRLTSDDQIKHLGKCFNKIPNHGQGPTLHKSENSLDLYVPSHTELSAIDDGKGDPIEVSPAYAGREMDDFFDFSSYETLVEIPSLLDSSLLVDNQTSSIGSPVLNDEAAIDNDASVRIIFHNDNSSNNLATGMSSCYDNSPFAGLDFSDEYVAEVLGEANACMQWPVNYEAL
jgi:hypothetical protein